LLLFWCVGVGVLMCWCADVLVCWCVYVIYTRVYLY
jgi:hypothetical protein